jgi:hypothetical protein
VLIIGAAAVAFSTGAAPLEGTGATASTRSPEIDGFG